MTQTTNIKKTKWKKYSLSILCEYDINLTED
jgi:hypothetical protein